MNEKYILLAEDNSDDVALTIRALKKNRIDNRLVVVSDGREAATYLFSPDLKEKPAVMLMDLKLPFTDGLELLRKIRMDDNTKSLPVIILSSSLDDKDRQKSLQLGANDFQCKPINFNEFVTLMEQICQQWL